MTRQLDTDHFYDLLDRLAQAVGGPRLLSDATARADWPSHGVYFFFEQGEHRANGQPRVVRVGTHALTDTSRTTLRTRLSQHRGHVGGSNPGGGNHRGSVFRLHVGAALINRGEIANLPLDAWLASRPRPDLRLEEQTVERAVSEYIGLMPVLCLGVSSRPDRSSDRGLVESAAIALLSTATGGVDSPSAGWLGLRANSPAVARSGLWNVRHVEDGYDPVVLDVLAAHLPSA
jgi:hypothetical protein